MPAGTHTFDFAFPLPATCPSSFEGLHGHVRYTVDCRIDRPWKFDHKTKRAFTLLGMSDMNTDPMAAQPYTATGEKKLKALFSKPGQVTCKFTLPKRSYVSGELVAVSGEVVNNSSRPINQV